MVEETVGYDEETVLFNKAVLHVKRSQRLFYKDISKLIGLTAEQGEQIRAGKRRASNKDILELVKQFPETGKFFPSIATNTTRIEGDETEQTLNEPMGTHFYGKKANPEPWEELVETQRKVIAMLERELAMVKERLMVVEAEKKTLVDIVSQRK